MYFRSSSIYIFLFKSIDFVVMSTKLLFYFIMCLFLRNVLLVFMSLLILSCLNGTDLPLRTLICRSLAVPTRYATVFETGVYSPNITFSTNVLFRYSHMLCESVTCNNNIIIIIIKRTFYVNNKEERNEIFYLINTFKVIRC